MSARVIGSGKWEVNGRGILMTTVFQSNESSAQQQRDIMWSIGQIVDVRPRTWAGINRPGGTGRITNIHRADKNALNSSSVVIGLDVKYTINSGHDLNLDPELVTPHVELETRGRRRAPAVALSLASEMDLPVPESKSRGKKNLKKYVRVASKKGDNSKTKLSLPRKIGMPDSRKMVSPAKKAARTPNCATKKPAVVSSIPLEIIFNTATVSDTPNSGCSKSRTSSSLGEEGVENPLLSNASYDLMIQPSRPSVGTSNAQCPPASQKGTNSSCQNNSIDCDVDFRISPRTDSDKATPESIFNARPIASGLFSNEHQNHAENTVNTTLPASESKENCENLKERSMIDQAFNRKNFHETMYSKTTLRDIYDNEVKRASQFVGAVVQGYHVESDVPTNDANIRDSRLNRFRSLLSDFLSDSDGMVETENLSNNLRNFARSSHDNIFDFTTQDIEVFVSELCAQNKIMQTEGWIYNI